MPAACRGRSVGLALVMLAVAVGVNMLLENLLQPVLLGDSLNVAPLPILLATALGGMLAGMIGLVLAAPLLAIALDAWRELKKSGFFDEPDAADASARALVDDDGIASAAEDVARRVRRARVSQTSPPVMPRSTPPRHPRTDPVARASSDERSNGLIGRNRPERSR